MIGLDTNVLVRIFAKDDPLQEKAALQLINSMPAGQKAVVNIVVVVELLWVLRRAYQFSDDGLVRVVRSLTDHRRLFLPEKDLLREAAHRAREHGGDIPDHIIALQNVAQGASSSYTFDRDAALTHGFTQIQ